MHDRSDVILLSLIVDTNEVASDGLAFLLSI
jgi:hypothetical protein